MRRPRHRTRHPDRGSPRILRRPSRWASAWSATSADRLGHLGRRDHLHGRHAARERQSAGQADHLRLRVRPDKAAYGSQTPQGSAGTATEAKPVTAELSGLQPGTTYHLRLVATNEQGHVPRPRRVVYHARGTRRPRRRLRSGDRPRNRSRHRPRHQSRASNSCVVAEAVLGTSVLIAPASAS